jgi:glycosyltransferase involved in cell wall biosynthesis
MRVLITTDAFPPVCGGSGWSTYELARGLRLRGHRVTIVRPRVGSRAALATAAAPRTYDDFQPIEFHEWAPPVPFVRNYYKNELLYRRLAVFLGDLIAREHIDVVHAQHLMSGPPSIVAAHAANRPVACTVRDYWPVCYWSDLIHDRSAATLCPGCSAGQMTTCLRPHAGAFWPLALPAIPYMRANLALKRRTLAEASAVIAVSGSIARDLRSRAPELAQTRIETIHNPVDVVGLRQMASTSARPLAEPYALYVGKLEPNKGVGHLLAAARTARLSWPLVVVGDGSERAVLEAEARAQGRDVRFTGWLSRPDVLAWLRHAGVLVFPSHGPESLSRVLIEASALAVPIAAMETGGTGDIVTHERTGLLSHSATELGDHVARLIADRELAQRLGVAASRHAEAHFAADIVVAQTERLYRDLLGAGTPGRAPREA